LATISGKTLQLKKIWSGLTEWPSPSTVENKWWWPWE